VINLIEHALEGNDALMFCMHMKLLRETCALLPTTNLQRLAYPEEPHKKLKIMVSETLCGQMIVKTPLWAVQHCLSCVCGMGKSYCIHTCEISKLSTAADGVFVICGHINPNCVSHESAKKRDDIPHDPMYNIFGPNLQKNKMQSVVLYFPSTGTYYSPRFVADTSRLQSKGMFVCNKGLATMHVLEMLPSTALHIRKVDGLPDVGGQLMTFTDVY